MMAGGVELISNDASASRAIWGGCTVPSLAYPVLESSSTLGPRHRGEQEGSLLPFQLLRQGTYIYTTVGSVSQMMPFVLCVF